MKQCIEILIANEHRSYRNAQKVLLSKMPHNNIKEVSSFSELYKTLEQGKREILIVDDMLPAGKFLYHLATIKKLCPNLKIIVTTHKDDYSYLQLLMQSVEGLLIGRTVTEEDFIRAVEAVNNGKSYYFTLNHSNNLFEKDSKKVAAAFGLELFNTTSGEKLSLENRDALYFNTTLRPTNEDCISLCFKANKSYHKLKSLPAERNLDIIDWRMKYLALNDFDFPNELQSIVYVKIFKRNFNDSINYFHRLLENTKISKPQL